jgi:hypothetical protein
MGSPQSLAIVRRAIEHIAAEESLLGAARELIAKSAWWYDHPCGQPCPAPEFANEVEQAECGVYLKISGERFPVGNVIRECAGKLITMVDEFSASEAGTFEMKVKETLGAVARKYAYDKGPDFMHYTVHAISSEEFVEEFLRLCEFHRLFA